MSDMVRETNDPDLEWFLIAGGAALRERGTLGAVVNMLELGGASGGVPNTDIYTDAQIGFGRHPIGDVERHRWLTAAWGRLCRREQAVLVAYYLAPRADFRGDQGFGARDQCPTVEELERKGVEEPRRGTHASVRTGAESNLGRYASLAFWLANDPARLFIACRDPDRRDGRAVIARALREAKAASLEAHRAWIAVKTGKPRRRKDRVKIGSAHTRTAEGERE